MSHYARIENGVVQEVIVAEQDVIDTGLFGDPANWIQTSFNTRAGKHLLGGTPLRKNFAGVGYNYDAQADAFFEPKPYVSWQLDIETYTWTCPVEYPQDGKAYVWRESLLEWVVIE